MSKDQDDYRLDLLYRLLPQVYRSRDGSDVAATEAGQEIGDMQAMLRVFSAAIARLDETLNQRLADSFPDVPPTSQNNDALACQEWVVPYFADLLDVSLVSPHADGQRTEVAKAVSWRQRKGTLGGLEDIIRSVADMEVVVQEGWRQVARTPHLDERGATRPARTMNLFEKSCAIAADNPSGYQIHNPNGVPCAPGSYADRSARTADLRDGGAERGQTHPGRVLLHFPPPAGFFPVDGPELAWDDRETAAEAGLIDLHEGEGVLRVRSLLDQPLRIKDMPVPESAIRLELDGVVLEGDWELPEGSQVSLLRCAIERLFVLGERDPELAAAIEAVDCLFGELRAKQGLWLEYSTVLADCHTHFIQASDCLFGAAIEGLAEQDGGGCIRYSRLQDEPPEAVSMEAGSCTCDAPHFFSTTFGEAGCGVLQLSTPKATRFGAEDQGEMGAYHHQRIALALEAVLEKTRDYLPAGLQPVLIPDSALAKRLQASETQSQD